MTFGERVKLARERKGLSQEELAKLLGYSGKSSISKIEAGLSDVYRSKVQEISNVLGVSISYLMGWTDIDGNSISKPKSKPSGKITPELRELILIFNQLSLDTQKNILQYANYLLSQENKHTFSEPDILPYVASSNLFDDGSNDKELSERVEEWKNENN